MKLLTKNIIDTGNAKYNGFDFDGIGIFTDNNENEVCFYDPWEGTVVFAISKQKLLDFANDLKELANHMENNNAT